MIILIKHKISILDSSLYYGNLLMKHSLIYLACFTVLSACSLAPKYERPALPVDNAFPAAVTLPNTANKAVNIGWKEYFQDPRLQQLIALALENNKDLKVAALNVEAARATHHIINADRLPTLAVSGEGSRSGSDRGGVNTNYQVGASIPSYELDFFGRVKSLSDAALSQYLASEEGRRSAQIALVSQVAISYYTERLLAEQLQVANDTLKSNQSSFNLVKQQVSAGIASELDLKQSETQVYNAKIQISILERNHKQAENALYLLLSTKPSTLAKSLALKDQKLSPIFSLGLPSDILLSRPDILAAEQNLKAANANIGAARAAFFPSISLTSSVGSASAELSDLFTSGTRVWNFSPRISLPIFDFGSRQANLDLAKIRTKIAVINYEKVIQKAFTEVSDAIVAKSPYEDQIKGQNALEKSQSELLRLATLRYNNGIASYLDILDAQRSLFSARQSVLSAYHGQLVNLVTLYSALGGGMLESSTANSIGGEVKSSELKASDKKPASPIKGE